MSPGEWRLWASVQGSDPALDVHPGVLESHLLFLVRFAMAHIVTPLDQPSNYKDSQSRVDRQTQNELLSKSSTLYVRPTALLWFNSKADVHT